MTKLKHVAPTNLQQFQLSIMLLVSGVPIMFMLMLLQ